MKLILIHLLLLTLLTGGLAACGGGGGGGKSAPRVGDDTLFEDQWHLRNTGQFVGASNGQDINVSPVWADDIKGEGVLVAVVDDGLQIAHEDLSQNVAPGKSYDYRNNGTNPSPVSENYHGTNVAGVIAARDMNAVGVRGVAPRASLAGYNLLHAQNIVTTVNMYDAMTRNMVEVAVSNNSWGLAVDGLGEAEPPVDSFWQDGIAEGVSNGRGGKGIIYVWAAGNGAYPPYSGEPSGGQDNSNYDYQANNRRVMAVCAVDGEGKHASYSEPGANLWICAPGGDDVIINGNLYSLGLATTDLMGNSGVNPGVEGDYTNRSYTRSFLGTSAATPQVSGVAALMLQANPGLGWRDVRLILAQSARKNEPGDSDWSTTVPRTGQPTYHINHKFGFGVVDAAAAVALARNWSNVSAEIVVEQVYPGGSQSIPMDGTPLQQQVALTDDLVIEYVEVDVSSNHQYPGDLQIVLTAPSGTRSVLAETHSCIDASTNLPRGGACLYQYNPWTFGSSRHLGESSSGTWTLTVEDAGGLANLGWYGDLTGWTLRIYGRAP